MVSNRTKKTAKPHFKEQNLTDLFRGVNNKIPIHQAQYSFDSREREGAFIEAMFPDPEEMARYREYRLEWHRRPKENDPGAAPLSVTCELVSTCNLACSMCYTISGEFKDVTAGMDRMMPWPTAKRIIDECAELGVYSMLLSWRGEPTLYRWRDGDEIVTFADVVAYARSKGILEITAITHGQEIDDEMAAAIVEAEPSWISFSIDGMGADYNKIRTPKNKDPKTYDAFSKVIGNVSRLAGARAAKGKTRPQIRSNAIYPAIAKDMESYYETLLTAGIDMITVNELLDLRAGDLEGATIREDWGCQYPFQRLTVTTGGTILPCTGAYMEQSGLVLGRYLGTPYRESDSYEIRRTAPEMTLKEAWRCEKISRIRELHQTARRCEIVPGCRDCNHGARKHGFDRLPDDWDMDSLSWKNKVRKG